MDARRGPIAAFWSRQRNGIGGAHPRNGYFSMTTLEATHCYQFGRFLLEPERRSLRAGPTMVPLGARAFDILLFLVRHHDRVVTKDEILLEVWRGTIVEENNLAVHISTLRRALGEKPGGDRFIATISGMGYRFVGAVREAALGEPSPGEPSLGGPSPGEPSLGGPAVMPAAVAEVVQNVATPPEAAVSSAPLRKAVWTRGRLVAAMAALAAVVVGLVAFEWRARLEAFDAPRLSIAVLPCRDLGGGPGDYLADAVTDDLTSDLSHIPDSVVIARESAETLRGRTMRPSEIGRTLRVRYLLQGSLLGEGKHLHVNARLVDAASGMQLWGSVFDVDDPDLAGSLNEIVERVSSALRFTLVQAEETQSLRRPAANPDALDLYLRAKSTLDRSTTFEGLVTAQALLERAIAKAPDDSNALAQLGLVLVHKIGDYIDPDEDADFARAKTFVATALSTGPQNPLAITARGMLAWVDGRCQEAQPSFRAALMLDPDNLQARNGLALCARQLGNMAEMIGQFTEMLRIDPIGPGRAQIENSVGMGYLMLGRPSAAIDWLNRAGADAGSDDQDTPTGLGWHDCRWVFLIAAEELSGNKGAASRLYREFQNRRPEVSVFQFGQYFSRSIREMPGSQAMLGALAAAGMPAFPPDGLPAVLQVGLPQRRGDYTPAPALIPGGQVIDAPTLHALMSSPARPLVLDVGTGASVAPGATWMDLDESSDDVGRMLQTEWPGSNDRTIVTMGIGPLGWDSYDVARWLISHGFRHVFWFRGGEAAWVKAGYPVEDRRAF